MTKRHILLCSLLGLGLLCQPGADALAQKKQAGDRKTAIKPKTAAPVRNLVPMGAKLDPLALARLIDQEVKLRLDAEGIKPSGRSDDAEFYRRAHLDILGIIPSAEKITAFLNSTDPSKRTKAIDEMLADPRYGQYQAELWTGQMIPRESNNRLLKAEPLRQWFTAQFNKNTPWDKLVADFVTASGPQDKNGAVTFYIGNPTADKMTDTVARMFLGVQLQCAQCHNHPFTSWKQDEYWGMAAFFMNVRVTGRPQQAAKTGATISVAEMPNAKVGKKGLPEGAKFLPAKFLQAEQPKVNKSAPLRPVLADWMTSKNNPFVARALVNRTWQHFLGRGIVNPYNDMLEENEPSHPELLHALTEQFKTNGFDVKQLIRAICNSETYQRTSKPEGKNGDFVHLYSVASVRNLTPEQFYDSLTSVIGTPGKRDVVANKVAAKRGGAGPREQFLAFFRVEDDNPLDYQAGIPQALRLMNSAQTNALQGVVNRSVQSGKTPAGTVEQLFLHILSRRPNSGETMRFTQYIGQQTDSRAAYADVAWALLNSSEFALNH